jgi:GntR family transcriptional repressor for pyruvate dehydrogenase complex
MSQPDAYDPRPYRQMADTIRQSIGDGTYQPGHALPSITVISEQNRHARSTVSKALRMLEGEGLIVRYPGLGYYVRHQADADPAGSSPGPA